MLSNDEPLLASLRHVVAVQGASTGSNVFVTGGLNQWFSVKEPAAEIAEILRQVLES